MSPKKYLTVTKPELLVDDSDGEFRRLIHDIIAYAGRIEEIRNRFGSQIGLTGSQYTILISIAYLEGSGGFGVNTVAERLHLSGAFVTTEINKLVTQGLVQKRIDDGDRRRVRLTITGEARRRLGALSETQAPVNNALFASLTKTEFRQLSNLMSRLVKHSDDALALLAFHARKSGT
jgi:DNA-binding MarR family transcriptional regulator